jgi:hypothetical protein
MRSLQSFLYLFAVTMMLQFCKSSDPAPAKPVDTPEITEQGTPFGTTTSATIGSAGGTITSADGLVTLDIPVGALDANTTISIQPITNTAPLGVDGFSYRFSPDGQTFKKPAKLTFNHTPDLLDNTSPQLLWIVTQAKDGSWSALTESIVDTLAQTLSGEIPHFSIWGAGRVIDISLDPPSATVLAGESVRLRINGFKDISSSPGRLAPLTPLEAAENDPSFNPLLPSAKKKSKFKFIGWQLVGGGSLKTEEGSWINYYTAPKSIPSINPVSVRMKLERYDYETNEPATIFRNVILVSNITITEPGELVINFKGTHYVFKQFENDNYLTFITDDEFNLVAAIPDASGFTPSFTISRSLTAKGSYTHSCNENDFEKDNVYYIGKDLSVNYSLQWCQTNPDTECTHRCGHFVSNITRWAYKPGEVVSGTFSGILYSHPHGESSHTITGYFNLVRR